MKPCINACVAAIAFLCLLTIHNSVQAADSRPDIVFVLSDDQAWDDYSFTDHEHIQTPNIDRLAREGLTFTRGYVPDSLCRPSLATIITGLYPHQHGIVGNDPPPSNLPAGARRGPSYKVASYQQDIETYLRLHIDEALTLPERLRPLGYTSMQTGKWWEGNFARGGFDQGMTHGDHNRGGRHGDVGLDIGRKTMQPISDFIQQARIADQPYFLWYAPMLPHTPHNPPKDLLEKYLELAPSESIAKYWAMCEWFDQTVGELREIIATNGRPDNTLIVYVCDNGWITRTDKSAYDKRSKRSQYEGGIRTPIIFHWPEKIAAEFDDQTLANSVDIVPSVLSLLGQNQDASLPGIDLTDEQTREARSTIFGEILEHDIQAMDDPVASLKFRWAIQGDFKLVIPFAKRFPDEPIELYNLAEDPSEASNLAEQQPELVRKLASELDQWWNPQ